MRILVFLQGTTIVHRNASGKSREEIIKQVQDQEKSVRDFGNYIPIGKAPQKLKKWTEQGAEIAYLSALTENKKARGDEVVGKEGLAAEKRMLQKYGFPEGIIYHREQDETYADVVRRVMPDILIEDDCESIGGVTEMTYPSLDASLQQKIRSVVIREFEGIDYLESMQ